MQVFLEKIERSTHISWKFGKQSSVALSTYEVEYMALSTMCEKVTYSSRFLLIYCSMTVNPLLYKTVIVTQFHYIRTL